MAKANPRVDRGSLARRPRIQPETRMERAFEFFANRIDAVEPCEGRARMNRCDAASRRSVGHHRPFAQDARRTALSRRLRLAY
ncbi:hypothetical protein Bamb_5560 [Burkholderia ambifaria AMMD]|uniref:Uncharacterized protein n=1 Tax=Burkholderia ambifaria (strain ATCC BAA-244 / DSM 16087 / CCUG 44356 / LMG 19182 / AMMD) TaxID=339670 RepID=Q0B416_BURCM|nr:hypothetical protein Bamb_5560 [Burkholderia ambifaria AMMD]